MQASVFLFEIQHLKQLKSVFLKIYNCVLKVAFLKSSHIYVSLMLLCAFVELVSSWHYNSGYHQLAITQLKLTIIKLH